MRNVQITLVPPNFKPKKKTAKQPITVNKIYWNNSRYWLPGSFLFGTESGVTSVKSPCMIYAMNQAGHDHDKEKKFPWNAPGTAPVASPCGTLGGWPQVTNAF